MNRHTVTWAAPSMPWGAPGRMVSKQQSPSVDRPAGHEVDESSRFWVHCGPLRVGEREHGVRGDEGRPGIAGDGLQPQQP